MTAHSCYLLVSFFRCKTVSEQEKQFLWRGAIICYTSVCHHQLNNMIGMITFFSQVGPAKGDGDIVYIVLTDSHIECSIKSV